MQLLLTATNITDLNTAVNTAEDDIDTNTTDIANITSGATTLTTVSTSGTGTFGGDVTINSDALTLTDAAQTFIRSTSTGTHSNIFITCAANANAYLKFNEGSDTHFRIFHDGDATPASRKTQFRLDQADTDGDTTVAPVNTITIHENSAAVEFNYDVEINGVLTLTTSAPPTYDHSTGTAGDIAWDASYVYVCTAGNTWKRILYTAGTW